MATRVVKRRLPQKEGAAPQVLSSSVEEFGRRLFAELEKRRWSQSDLARKAWPDEKPKTDRNGYAVVPKRDLISSWVRGKAVPTPANLDAICKAMHLDPAELAPDLTASAVRQEPASFSMQVARDRSDLCYVRVNRLMPMSAALKIGAIIDALDQDTK